ncbi:phosphotransferase [Microbacterium sp. CIAB417]|uniref:phosphotransferase n=1 Tax=Microbacterium sp. CIAB417 TaxID=2860287 RepID=UPI001FADAE81|nr:phosphotransferase [Microbacterium sp. CIAB417]
MHPGQLHVDEQIARRLLGDQFPQWRDEPVRHVPGAGTVNAIFRVGEHLSARFPLEPADTAELSAQLTAEAAAMTEFAAACPVPAPVPVAQGAPGEDYPQPWSIQSWVPGDVATPDGLARSDVFARDLVGLLGALRAADTRGRRFRGSGRGGDLRDSDAWIEHCLEQSIDLLPVDELLRLWMLLRDLPVSGPDRMTHGDLTPANLLVRGERLAGVLDTGGFAAADPSLDLVAAWHLLDAEARGILRSGLDATEIEWWRGAAWAFQQAMGLVWYYRESNPDMSALGRSTLHRILSDPEIASGRTPA